MILLHADKDLDYDQRCKKRQIWQIYLCYFMGTGANFWDMHTRTSAISISAIITSGISTIAISTSAIITGEISISAIITSAIKTSAIYAGTMFLGANESILWQSTFIHRFYWWFTLFCRELDYD